MRKADDPDFYFECHVFCCLNRREEAHPRGSCAARGSEALVDYMKQQVKALRLPKVRVNGAKCLDRCELGPTMVIYPEGIWYHYETKADVDEIIEQHIRQGKRVERLMLQPKQKRL